MQTAENSEVCPRGSPQAGSALRTGLKDIPRVRFRLGHTTVAGCGVFPAVPGIGPACFYRFSKALCNSSGAIGLTLTGLAGIPATMWKGWTSFDTTPIEPTMPCSLTLTPLRTVA